MHPKCVLLAAIWNKCKFHLWNITKYYVELILLTAVLQPSQKIRHHPNTGHHLNIDFSFSHFSDYLPQSVPFLGFVRVYTRFQIHPQQNLGSAHMRWSFGGHGMFQSVKLPFLGTFTQCMVYLYCSIAIKVALNIEVNDQSPDALPLHQA